MANPFLNSVERDIETAIMLERAYVHDIGKAVAYTDGTKVFVNTDDNLFSILPNYNHNMLKWLLWHERYHMELRHHNRFFKYLSELDEKSTLDKFQVTKEEVNIIMDILVHDSLGKLFPELVDTALENLAQFRNRNSLGYTFKTFTLEEMLSEYADYKKSEAGSEAGSEEGEGEHKDGEGHEGDGDSEEDKDKKDGDKKKKGKKKSHEDGTTDTPSHADKDKVEKEEPEIIEDSDGPAPEHDKTDWSKLKDIDTKEFISERESRDYIDEINRLKRKRIRLAALTETLNGLATGTRRRTYAKPSTIQLPGGAILKGTMPSKAKLYLVFDASGSMMSEMQTFKDIISKSIPQAMTTPTEWFSGYGEEIAERSDRRDYYKGTFKDFMPVRANAGYNDDGDRTIELCYYAEQLGYTPIGITDGGGCISWSKDKLVQLRRTIFVGDSSYWLSDIKRINPHIQTLYID